LELVRQIGLPADPFDQVLPRSAAGRFLGPALLLGIGRLPLGRQVIDILFLAFDLALGKARNPFSALRLQDVFHFGLRVVELGQLVPDAAYIVAELESDLVGFLCTCCSLALACSILPD
jgi:hypothetical protein